MKSNTPEAFSACFERLYSGEKLVLETKCNHLGDKNFEKLMLSKISNKDICMKKDKMFRAGYSTTISGHFFQLHLYLSQNWDSGNHFEVLIKSKS